MHDGVLPDASISSGPIWPISGVRVVALHLDGSSRLHDHPGHLIGWPLTQNCQLQVEATR